MSTDRPEVLFVCVHNAGRSQMAAALTHALSGGRVRVRSAGSEPAEQINPAVVTVMAELGVDLSLEFPKPLSDAAVEAADVVVSMGCGDACPIYPGKRYLEWVVDDPAGRPIEKVRAIRDEIRARVDDLLVELDIHSQTAGQIRAVVRSEYGARAQAVATGRVADCCGGTQAADLRERLYASDEAGSLPESVVSYGCGNPIAIAGLQPGEVVLDLGSGAGLDCFLAAQRVAPDGRAIGLDMTDEMLALAEQNKARLGLANVEFRKGLIEAIPLADGTVDAVISNCVINLSPEKDAVFAEAFRVLRPGGRLQVSDIVILRDLSPSERADLDLWTGCIAGALERGDYARRLALAGFEEISIDVQERSDGSDGAWQSALITAYKPGGGRRPRRPWQGEPIQLIAPAGLATGACCGDDCCTTGA